MKKNLFLAALAFVALASCTNDEFVGENTSPTTSGNAEGAILFESSTPRITRSDGATAAGELGYSFYVYATKTLEGTTASADDDVTSNVFAHNVISGTSNTPYQVWYSTTSSANSTTTNTHIWEYVGNKQTTGESPTDISYGNGNITLYADQTIKYWDYSAKNYTFTAYKAKAVGEPAAAGSVTNVTTSGFTFEGTANQFANLYVADKLVITEKANPAAHTTADNKIGDAVKLTFRSGASKVRLGIYETILGYNVQNVSFKPTSPATFSATTAQAQLSGTFNDDGSNASASKTFTVTYGEDGKAQFATSGTTSNNFVFGSFDSDGDPYLGESSTSPTWATGSSDYVNVFPNQDHTAAMVLKVDYELYNTVTHETIKVTDATAVVPQMYMTWNPNYAYTYLFKISDNTNGYTGGSSLPSGLYPISFDAVTVAATDGQEVGTITTVSAPAITTYQEGSVVNTSEHGITYAASGKPIYITVNTGGTLKDLSSSDTKLYTVNAGTTEADLILNVLPAITGKTEVAAGFLTIPASGADAETLQGITFTAGKYAKFTPVAGTTYAVEYLVSAAVNAVYTQVTSGTSLTEGKKYYTSDTGAGEFTAGASVSAGESTYELTTAASPAVYQYKIIEVAAASGSR